MKTLIVLLFLSQNVLAEDWFCKHEAGKRDGNVIWACGLGEATDESSARHYALKDAQREFDDICEMSSDCRGQKLTVDPQRTTCEEHNGHVKCFRLLVITLKH